MEATPREQVAEVALATKLTGDPTEAPFPGLLTVTPANAEVARVATKQTYAQRLFMPVTISRL